MLVWHLVLTLQTWFGPYALWKAIIGAVLLGLLLFAAAIAHVIWWRRRLRYALPYASQESIATGDGSRIELRRVGSEGAMQLPPILIVHGVASNHRNQDAHPTNSLARHLAALGRDVWLVTLRSGLHLGRSLRTKSCFSNMAVYDVPLAIRAVLERTGAAALDYVGFSMGGMLLYAALDRGVKQASIRRAVLVGSPGRIAAPIHVPRLLGRIPRWLVPRLPLRLLAISVAFISEYVPSILHRPILNPRNMSRGMTRLALANCIEDVPGPLHADFLRWASGTGVVISNGEPILEGLSLVCVPALFVAGSDDRIAPVGTVRDAFEAWGKGCEGVEKQFLVLGRDVGSKCDYGHGDLAMGAAVANDLFVPIVKFLGSGKQPVAAAIDKALEHRQ